MHPPPVNRNHGREKEQLTLDPPDGREGLMKQGPKTQQIVADCEGAFN
jgi:hypothetical protein